MITLKNVRKKYDTQEKGALRGVSFHIKPGEFVFVVGHSGSGKSTLLSILHGDEEADSGVITVNGVDVAHLTSKKLPYYRRQVGMVFQDFKLIQTKTVKDNLVFAMRAIGAGDEQIQENLHRALQVVGLDKRADSYPSQLSGGEQQRVAIARAIINAPPVLLADEPTGNLDPKLSYEIMRLFERINETGTTVVVVTHDHAMVDRFRKRVIRLEKGKITEDNEDGQYTT